MTHRVSIFVRYDPQRNRDITTKAHYIHTETGKAVCGPTFHGIEMPADCDAEICEKCQAAVDAGRVLGFELEEWDE